MEVSLLSPPEAWNFSLTDLWDQPRHMPDCGTGFGNYAGLSLPGSHLALTPTAWGV